MKTFCLLIVALSFPLIGCNAPPRQPIDIPSLGRQPVVRIGIVEQRSSIQFKLEKAADFQHQNGSMIFQNASPGKWTVEVVNGASATLQYRLAVGIFKKRFDAEDVVDSLEKKGILALVKKYQLDRALNIDYAHDATYQVLLLKTFDSEEDARRYQIELQEKTNSEIVVVPRGVARGSLRFTNASTGQAFQVKGPIRLQGVEVEVADVDVGNGFHWESSETRRYGEQVEFILDFTGNITMINSLPLEEYIRGVVPSEMPSSFPFEALKAQAVTARVEAISKIGLRHPLEAFDLCDDVHCQAFGGLSKRAPQTDRATDETRGIFMIYDNELAEAYYAGVCGGHTENNANVWVMNQKSYLHGTLDKLGKALNASLEDEEQLRKWLDSSPDVFCNTSKANVPASVDYSKKFFRWEVEYKRLELERIIREKTGEEFGSLLDLRPVKRGVSGRLIELEIVGSKKKFKIGKELAIRQALSKRTLYSACFYVEKIGPSKGMPTKFVLKGGGWGHGVGMCQVGAAVMAHRGQTFDQILSHYYNAISIEKLYQ